MHTPGPWHVRAVASRAGKYAERDFLIHTDDNCHVAEVFQYQNTTHPDGPSEANARLIAAAPTLLGVAGIVVLLGPGDPGVEGLKEQARAAIAQAEGECH